MTTLVIVESPAKAKKIAGYLGNGYAVQAGFGHVRDLPGNKQEIPEKWRSEPWATLGVHPETFQPIYVVPDKKKDVVAKLRALASKADRVILASDDDREGESISWHLAQLLKLKDPQRMVFHKVTKEALQVSLKNLRPLDLHLVAAQEARRVIDRLVGYKLSPLLWNTVGKGLSAGRVQSAALMLVAQRESLRMRFKPSAFWLIRRNVGSKPPFVATLTHLRTKDRPDGQPIARASDFTGEGLLKDGADVLIMDDAQVKALVAYLDGKQATIHSVVRSETRSKPNPPFITSTLQQAGGRLNLSAKQVMDIAQKLYDTGYITYMRTDSPALSDEALEEARKEAVRMFGQDAVPAAPRQYATRNKNAQEAHEAIRPAGTSWRPPDKVDLSGAELAVYTLIYQRTVASQMNDALYDKTVVTLTCGAATLMAQGRVLTSPGYTQLLSEDDEQEKDNQRLPELSAGEPYPLKMRPPEGKKTSAPGRYTEATLVQAMEKAGIGRPSTDAQTLATLQTRDDVRVQGRALAMTATGLLVATYLVRQVPEVMQREFTAGMETGLDEIAAGKVSGTAYLGRFWTQELEQVIRRARRDAPALPLPHLPGVSLQASLEGPFLLQSGVRVAFPQDAIPADLQESDLKTLLEGRWRARTTPRSAPSPDLSPAPKAAKPRTTGHASPAKPAKPRAPRKKKAGA